MESQVKLETLDTTYVSLAALIRHLRQKEFRGRLHVVLAGYEADVFLYGSADPSVWEKDLSTGRETRGEEAQQRLLVLSREPGGLITIYEGTTDATPTSESNAEQDTTKTDEFNATQVVESSAEIIAAVERAVESAGVEFAPIFRQVRIQLGDDYAFLDPTAGDFEYNDGKVALAANLAPTTFQRALIGGLKRVVDHVAQNHGEARFRERVALELALAARRQAGRLGEFESQLDRIAGTRVL